MNLRLGSPRFFGTVIGGIVMVAFASTSQWPAAWAAFGLIAGWVARSAADEQ